MPINSVSSTKNQLTNQEVTSQLQAHLKGVSFDKLTNEQKDILQQRQKIIEKCVRLNFRGDPRTDIDNFLKKMDEMIVHAGAPVIIPDMPKFSTSAANIYGVLFEKIPSFKEIWHDKKLQKHLLLEQNPELMAEGRELMQTLLRDIFNSIHSAKDAVNVQATEALIGNILAFYPFLDPQEGGQLEIPFFENNQWNLGKYTIESIEMTPSWMGSPAMSYGLKPNSGEPPLMLFKGTSYPTDKGFFLQILTDFNPFASVGSYLYSICKKSIKNWLETNSQKFGRGVRLYGVSLGGALIEHTVSDFPHLVEKVYAYNAPAMLGCELSKWNKLWKANKGKGMPEVNIYCQENDIVSQVGLKWGKGWNVYKVFGPLKCPNTLLSHIRSFFADKEALILKMDRRKDCFTGTRWLLTILHQIFSLPFFIIGSLIWLIHIGVQNLIRLMGFKKMS